MNKAPISLTKQQIADAIAVYLRLAFPGDSRPRRRVPDVLSAIDMDAILGEFELDVASHAQPFGCMDQVRTCRRYVLRLGNHAYPHMKFTIEQAANLRGWFFAVDCHDDAVHCPSPSDEEAWRPILEQNRAIRIAIETAWDAAGLPSRRQFSETEMIRLSTSPSSRNPKREAGVTAPLILVVDDEEDAAELFAIYLRRAGFRTVVVTDACEVMSMARRVRPDLILLDYMMEPLSGAELVAQIRADHALKATPTMICTYADLSADIIPAADAVLRKPLSREQLVTRVADFLSARQSGR